MNHEYTSMRAIIIYQSYRTVLVLRIAFNSNSNRFNFYFDHLKIKLVLNYRFSACK